MFPKGTSDYWELRIGGIINCVCLLPYFNKYGLKTKKEISYLRWKELLFSRGALQSKDHLNMETRQELIKLCSLVNKFD